MQIPFPSCASINPGKPLLAVYHTRLTTNLWCKSPMHSSTAIAGRRSTWLQNPGIEFPRGVPCRVAESSLLIHLGRKNAVCFAGGCTAPLKKENSLPGVDLCLKSEQSFCDALFMNKSSSPFVLRSAIKRAETNVSVPSAMCRRRSLLSQAVECRRIVLP